MWRDRRSEAGAVLAAVVALALTAAIRRRRRIGQRAKGARMGADMNKEIVRRVEEEPWRGNFDVIDEHVAEDYVGYDPSQPEAIRGREAVKEFIRTYKAAFPDSLVTVDAIFADGDIVITRWNGRGTHEGELMGIAPTGKEATVTGITISRLANGKVAESWSQWDTLGLLIQLGAVPEPTRA
jgi:steroid delta-isomerase-like uncharacterized protein